MSDRPKDLFDDMLGMDCLLTLIKAERLYAGSDRDWDARLTALADQVEACRRDLAVVFEAATQKARHGDG